MFDQSCICGLNVVNRKLKLHNNKLKRMKQVISLTLIILMISCGSKAKQEQTVLGDQSNNIISNTKTDESSQKEQDDFLPFWIEYREMVMKMDSNKLMEITRFPLTVKGYEDDDPIIKISKSEFWSVFNEFLNTGGGVLDINDLDDMATNNMDFIKRSPNAENTLRYYEQNSNYHQIGDNVFEIIDGKWMLTLIYLDTKNGLPAAMK